MKIRFDFVTNSSSSSFVVSLNVFDNSGKSIEVFRTDEGFDSEDFYDVTFFCGKSVRGGNYSGYSYMGSDDTDINDEDTDDKDYFTIGADEFEKYAEFSTFSVQKILIDALYGEETAIPDIAKDILSYLEKNGIKKESISKIVVSEVHNSSAGSISIYPDEFVDWARYNNSGKSVEEMAKLCNTDVESMEIYLYSFPWTMAKITSEGVDSHKTVVWYKFYDYADATAEAEEIFERTKELEASESTNFIIDRRYFGMASVSDLEYVEDVVVGCKENKSFVVIPNGVREISSYSFRANGTRLTKVVISDSVKIIGDGAFEGCNCLKEVILPENLEHIGAGAFQSVGSFTMLGEGKRYYVKNNSIIDRKTKTLVFGSTHSIIPADGSVKTIGRKAFAGNRHILFITVPEGVECIEDLAFAGHSLRSINLPLSLKKIEGGKTFSSWSEYIPDKIKVYYAGTKNDWENIEKNADLEVNFEVIFEHKSGS